MTDVTSVAWDIGSILGGRSIDDLFDAAESSATELADLRGRVGTLDAGQLADAMHSMATVMDLLARAGYHPMLSFSTDTSDPARGAAMAHSQQRATQINTMLIFFELEWAAADDEHVAGIIGDNRLDFCRHHLEQVRLERPHLLSEAEETVLADKAQVGGAAWVRLFDELTSAIEVDVPDEHGGTGVSLMEALSLLSHPDRSIRQQAAEGVTAGLAPGLRTRAYVFNTLLLDKSISDRQRGYNTWISSRNLANEASDESVNALIEAVVSNYSLPQRWYRLKAQVLGIDKLADYDRMASVADTEQEFVGMKA